MGSDMVNIDRVRVELTGFPGAPGVSTFYALNGASLQTPLFNFYTALKGIIPADVHMRIASSGDTLDSSTGTILASWTGTVQTDVNDPTNVSAYAAPTGGVITWLTGTRFSGRLLKGRTFIVPLTLGQFATDGSFTAGGLAVLTDAATAFVAASTGNFLIWQRPRAARAADGSRKAITARSGGHAVVVGSRVADKAGVLRSRRD